MIPVYYNLAESPFQYGYQKFHFYFSSKVRMDKFIKGINDYIKMETFKLNGTYRLNCNFEEMLILSYYKKIENRGFYCKYNNTLYDDKDFNMRVILKKVEN